MPKAVKKRSKKARRMEVAVSPALARVVGLGPPPEQVAHQEYVLAARSEINDVAKKGPLPVKRARTIDTWRKRGIIDYRLWLAADWYERKALAAGMEPRCTGSYGQGAGGGVGFYAILPHTEAQAIARTDLHWANQALADSPLFLKVFQRVVVDNWTATDVGRYLVGITENERHVRWRPGERERLTREERDRRIQEATNKLACKQGIAAWKIAAEKMADRLRKELGLDAPAGRV